MFIGLKIKNLVFVVYLIEYTVLLVKNNVFCFITILRNDPTSLELGLYVKFKA